MSSFNPEKVQQLFEELREAVIPEITTMEQQGISKDDIHEFVYQYTEDWFDSKDREDLLAGNESLSEGDREQLRFRLKELLGAGALEGLLAMTDVENIHVFGSHKAVLTYNDGRKEEIGPITDSDEHLIELVRHLASVGSRTSRRFDQSSPLLDLRLPSGHRLFAIMEVSSRPHLSIRRHATHKVDFDYLVSRHSITAEVGEFLKHCVLPPGPVNMLVAGGTNTGKTTFLRALINEIPKYEVLVTIEDTLELHLTKSGAHERCYELETRTANIEGTGAISMYDLAKAALRMAPDRVIVGEVRGGEVMQLLTAMGQGNDGSVGTIHANSSQAVISRILTYSQRSPDATTPDFVLRQVGETLHLILFLERWGPDQRRQVASIREVIGYQDGDVLTSEIFSLNEDGVLTYRRPLSPKGETYRRLSQSGFDFSILGDPIPEADFGQGPEVYYPLKPGEDTAGHESGHGIYYPRKPGEGPAGQTSAPVETSREVFYPRKPSEPSPDANGSASGEPGDMASEETIAVGDVS